MNQKIKDWIFSWIAFSLTSLLIFSMSAFAYSKIETVKSGDVLSADSYNKLVNRVNDLEFQLEWNYQTYFDTNKFWTWKKFEWKKVYSKWVNFGDFSWTWSRKKTHWIEWIDRLMSVETNIKLNSDNSLLIDWAPLWIKVDKYNIEIETWSFPWSTYNWWFRIEYTKIND